MFDFLRGLQIQIAQFDFGVMLLVCGNVLISLWQ